MKGPIALRIPIEAFVISFKDASHGAAEIIYFDPKGVRHVVQMPRTVVEAAMAQLDGGPKAIARSSGGLVSAQPYQLVLHHSVADRGAAAPELRIKVRFKEFVRDEHGRVSSGNVMTVTKNLLPSELQKELAYDLKSTQKFLLDFGQGAVPVTIFSFVSDAMGENQALFVEADAIERAIRAPAGSKIQVQRYKVAKDLLRVVPDAGEAAEILGKAQRNFERLKRNGSKTIPDWLKAGEPVEIPTGSSYHAICELLRQSTHRWNRQASEEATLSEYELRDEGCVTSDFLLFMEPI